MLRRRARLQGWPNTDDFHIPLIEISLWSLLVAHNIFRKSGVAMVTPHSIVDEVTVRLDCQEIGVDFDPLRDRYCRNRPHDCTSCRALLIASPTTANANACPSDHLLNRGPATLSTLISCSSMNRMIAFARPPPRCESHPTRCKACVPADTRHACIESHP